MFAAIITAIVTLPIFTTFLVTLRANSNLSLLPLYNISISELYIESKYFCKLLSTGSYLLFLNS